MNYAGKPLLSKETVISGRTLLVLSVSVCLSVLLDIDVSTFSFLGIELAPAQLSSALHWVIVVLWVSLLVHWFGDLSSLGQWNSAMVPKKAEARIGGGGKLVGEFETAIGYLRGIEPTKDVKRLQSTVDVIEKKFDEMVSNRWWHERLSIFYVVGWGFAVPTVMAILASLTLYFGLKVA